MSLNAKASPDVRDRLARIIAEYDAQGVHRTGTRVDHTCADWLCENITALGAEPRLVPFTFQRVEIKSAYLALEGEPIPGIPLYDCGYTSASGIDGRLGPIGSKADIGVAMAPPFDAAPQQLAVQQARQGDRHKAILIVTDDQMPPGVALLNAESSRKPFGPPVLQVSNDAWPRVSAAIENNTPVRLVAEAESRSCQATNVEARIVGSRPELAPLVIMTPRSGWWESSSERGGGIAAFLELLRTVIAPKRTVIFTANTGHELGHLGLDAFLEGNEGLIATAHCWIHLGANFAARVGPNIRLQYSDAEIADTLQSILNARSLEPGSVTPPGIRPAGEARNIYDGGGRYLSILGGNGLFHHPADRYPDAVDLETTARWTECLVEVTQQLAGD
jgi:hypothetical protein